MMVRPRAEHGFIAAFIPRRDVTARGREVRRICLGTAGDLHGQMIAASFITGPRRSRMGRHGANGKNLSGGTRKKRNGADSTIRTTKRIWRLIRPTTCKKEKEGTLWAERGLARCIRMAWGGFMWLVDCKMVRCQRTMSPSSRRFRIPCTHSRKILPR